MSLAEEMDEIREYLLIQYNGASIEAKKRIKILINEAFIDYLKCPNCGCKFGPEEGEKSAIIMFPKFKK